MGPRCCCFLYKCTHTHPWHPPPPTHTAPPHLHSIPFYLVAVFLWPTVLHQRTLENIDVLLTCFVICWCGMWYMYFIYIQVHNIYLFIQCHQICKFIIYLFKVQLLLWKLCFYFSQNNITYQLFRNELWGNLQNVCYPFGQVHPLLAVFMAPDIQSY